MSEKKRSKSQRVRDYLTENPSARNKDVVKALSQYGVTAADVSNAKAHMNRTESNRRTRQPVEESGTSDLGQTFFVAANGQVAYAEIQAALSYVEKIGSIDRAKQLLALIQQIRSLPTE